MSCREDRGNRRSARRVAFEAQVRLRVGEIRAAEGGRARAAATEKLVAVLRRIHDSEFTLWSFEPILLVGPVAGARPAEERDEMRALIAQIVAPHLAGTGRRFGEAPPVTGRQTTP